MKVKLQKLIEIVNLDGFFTNTSEIQLDVCKWSLLEVPLRKKSPLEWDRIALIIVNMVWPGLQSGFFFFEFS